MERDPKISKLMRESGLIAPPADFSEKVMKKIGIVPKKVAYKPLIGRTGRILVLLFIIGIVMVSLLYSEPGGRIIERLGELPGPAWKLPNINYEFLSGIKPAGWLVSTIVAIFLLVLSDAGLNKRRLI